MSDEEPYQVFVSIFGENWELIEKPYILIYNKTSKIEHIIDDIKMYLSKLGSVEYQNKNYPLILDNIKLELFQIDLSQVPKYHEPLQRKDLGKLIMKLSNLI